jgi:hypothetical protein
MLNVSSVNCSVSAVSHDSKNSQVSTKHPQSTADNENDRTTHVTIPYALSFRALTPTVNPKADSGATGVNAPVMDTDGTPLEKIQRQMSQIAAEEAALREADAEEAEIEDRLLKAMRLRSAANRTLVLSKVQDLSRIGGPAPKVLTETPRTQEETVGALTHRPINA